MQQIRTIAAGEFKARCLALLDEVGNTKLPLLVTKRGRPIAKLVPCDGEGPKSLLGSVQYETESDLLAPADESWDAER